MNERRTLIRLQGIKSFCETRAPPLRSSSRCLCLLCFTEFRERSSNRDRVKGNLDIFYFIRERWKFFSGVSKDCSIRLIEIIVTRKNLERLEKDFTLMLF